LRWKQYAQAYAEAYQNINDLNPKVCLDYQIKVYVRVSADTKTCGSPLNICHLYGGLYYTKFRAKVN